MTEKREAEFRNMIRMRLENGQRVGDAVIDMIAEYDWKTVPEQQAVLIDIAVQEAQAAETRKRR